MRVDEKVLMYLIVLYLKQLIALLAIILAMVSLASLFENIK